MSNTQLLAEIKAIVSSEVSRVEERIEKRFDMVEMRFISLERTFNDRFVVIDTRFDAIERSKIS